MCASKILHDVFESVFTLNMNLLGIARLIFSDSRLSQHPQCIHVDISTAVAVANGAKNILKSHFSANLVTLMKQETAAAVRQGLPAMLRLYRSVIQLHTSCAMLHPEVSLLPGKERFLPLSLLNVYSNFLQFDLMCAPVQVNIWESTVNWTLKQMATSLLFQSSV